MHFTVHNDSNQPAVAELIVDRTALSITGKPTWREVLSDSAIIASDRMRFELEAHRTKVFAVSTSD
ncbi:MAG: hypothetical protein ACYTG0_03500 [Planctomycetota bacterium]